MRFRFGTGAIAISTLLAFTACAPQADPEPTPTAAPETSAPEPYAGPAVFVGDELDWFMLSADEIASLLAGATEIGSSTSVLEQISDGGGPNPVPEVCTTFFLEQSLGSVGSRNVGWTPEAGAEYKYGHLFVLQFADEEQAQHRMDQLIAAAEQCATFDYAGQASFESVIPEASEHARTMAGTLILPPGAGGEPTFTAYATVGNVLVQLSQTVDEGAGPDAQKILTLLEDRAEDARATLVEQLTANPPTTEDEPAVDPAAPWSDWEITAGGVGPIRIGDPIDTAVAAGRGAQTLEPEYERGPLRLVDESGSASMLIQPSEDGATAAWITVGSDRSIVDSIQDGASLPSAGGVRVGDPVADAITAFPGGTTVTVASSGDDWYDLATRDGRLLRFHADRDVVDQGALIVGITVEDATLRPFPVFS